MENKLKVEYVDIDTIKPYKNNAKLHPKEQIEQIKKSIENFGMNDPIGIWNNEIVEGHGRILACKELGYKQSNIWQISREINREEQGNHPTPKPIELIAKALNNSSKQEDIILDVFGGSGSTLIACEQLNRKCYMMELDPHYIDVIIQRWENFTGEKAVKIQ